MAGKKVGVSDISALFPDIPVQLIQKDLDVTFSGEETINRILDGQIFKNDRGNELGGGQASDDDLPELREATHNAMKKPKLHTSPDLPVIMLDGADVPTTATTFNAAKLSAIRKDFLSDNSGSEDDDIPDLPVLGFRKDTLTGELTTGLTTGLTSSSQGSGLSGLSVGCQNTDFSQTGPSCEGSADDSSQVSEWREERSESEGGKVSVARKRTHREIGESKKQAKELKEDLRRRKEEEKARKQQEREEKKRQAEYEKQRKRTLQEARRQAKPGECMKYMTVVLSPGILKESCGAAILDSLQKAGVKYDIQTQVHDNLLTLWREVNEVTEVAPMKLESVSREKVEDSVLMILPVTEFIGLVYNFKQKQLGLPAAEDLHEHITLIKGSLEGRDVTVIVQGLEKYFRAQKSKENRAFKKQVQGSSGGAGRDGKGREDKTVTRLDVEEALVHLQLSDGCNIRFIEDDQEVARTVKQYVKAVAETPFKRDRLQTGFTFHLSGSRSAPVDREGSGLAGVWRLQLQQFPLVSAEVANTVMGEYSSPRQLMEAYKRCESVKQAERLLENLEVRRGAGVMATSRRVGKEFSRRLYQFYTCADPHFVIP